MIRRKAELESWMQQQGDMGAETEALVLERMAKKEKRGGQKKKKNDKGGG